MDGYRLRGHDGTMAGKCIEGRYFEGEHPMSDTPPARFRTWMCVVCGFLYHEAEGLPEEGIAPGTRWEEVPDTWTCPDCGVTKADFEMVELD
jgi:rubredoxin